LKKRFIWYFINNWMCLIRGKKKPLEERLKGDKIYHLYKNFVPAANDLSMVSCVTKRCRISKETTKYTNSQMALRKDLLKKKVRWTGDFMTDFKYYIWFHHPIISIFRASNLDSYTRCERLVVLTILIMVNVWLTYLTIYIDEIITECRMDYAEPDAYQGYAEPDAYHCDDRLECFCEHEQDYIIFPILCYDGYQENLNSINTDSCTATYAIDVSQLTQTLKLEIHGPLLMCPLDMTYLYQYIYCNCDDEKDYIFFYDDDEFYGDYGQENREDNYPHGEESIENYDDSCNADAILYALQQMQAVELVILEPFLVFLLRCGHIQKCCNCCVSFMEGLGYFIVGVIFLTFTYDLIWIQSNPSLIRKTFDVPTFFLSFLEAWFVFDVLWSFECFRQQNRQERWIHRTPDQEKFELSLRIVKIDADIVPSDKGWCWFSIMGLMMFWPWFITSDEKDWNLVPKSESRAVDDCPSSVAEEEEDVPPESENSAAGIVLQLVEINSGMLELE